MLLSNATRAATCSAYQLKKDFKNISYSVHQRNVVKRWLRDHTQSQDLISPATAIAGFEWPSILMVTSINYDSQFHVRNIVMRAMCRLSWLKTSLIDQVYETGKYLLDTTNLIWEKSNYWWTWAMEDY